MSNEIVVILSISCFLVGLIAGATLMIIGVKYGFKASYQIRETISGEEMPDSLLKHREDPAEFDLIDEEPES